MYASNATNEQDISKHVAVWQKKKKRCFLGARLIYFSLSWGHLYMI